VTNRPPPGHSRPATDPTQPTTGPTQPTAGPPAPATDLTRPAAESTQPAAEPARPAAEPAQLTAEPTRPAAEPTRPATGPTLPAAEPIRPVGPSRLAGRSFSRFARRLALLVIVALVGCWLGLTVGGHASAQIGPVSTEMAIVPAVSGQTVISVPPLGSLQLATHHGPLRLDVDVQELSGQAVKKLLNDPNQVKSLPDQVAQDLRHGVITVAVRSLIAVTAAGLMLGLLVFRRAGPAVAAGLLSLAVLAAGGGVAAATWNPKSIFEPRYTGLLTGAPSLVGNVQEISVRFGLYRQELAALVTNVTRLYAATSTLPVYQPDASTIRVLDVSDIHDNPTAFSVMHSISHQFAVNFIIDSGDLTDHGSAPENHDLAREIRTFHVPYVFIRGNHDSYATQAAVARQPNAIVLRGHIVTVDGLRIIGQGDPRFTPDLDVEASGEDVVAQMGQRLADTAAAARPPPNIAVVHDPVAAAPFAGVVPLVLAGHIHHRVTWMLPGGTRLFVQGSTGGAGLRALQANPPTPIECSVLYFDSATGRLQAWDDITVSGLGGTAAQIQRHLATDTAPIGGPLPAITPPPSTTPTPSTSPDPSASPGPTSSSGPTSPPGPSSSSGPSSSRSSAPPDPSSTSPSLSLSTQTRGGLKLCAIRMYYVCDAHRSSAQHRYR
jgi:predicted MPP superfamily phosphohydrolase